MDAVDNTGVFFKESKAGINKTPFLSIEANLSAKKVTDLLSSPRYSLSKADRAIYECRAASRCFICNDLHKNAENPAISG